MLRIYAKHFLLSLFCFLNCVGSGSSAADIDLQCHPTSDLTSVDYKNFGTHKIERGEDDEMVALKIRGGRATFATISCDIDPPVNMHSNVSFMVNDWGRIRVTATPSSGFGESLFIFNPRHNVGINVLIISVRGISDGYGTVFQTMYKCKNKILDDFSSLCDESKAEDGDESTVLSPKIVDASL